MAGGAAAKDDRSGLGRADGRPIAGRVGGNRASDGGVGSSMAAPEPIRC